MAMHRQPRSQRSKHQHESGCTGLAMVFALMPSVSDLHLSSYVSFYLFHFAPLLSALALLPHTRPFHLPVALVVSVVISPQCSPPRPSFVLPVPLSFSPPPSLQWPTLSCPPVPVLHSRLPCFPFPTSLSCCLLHTSLSLDSVGPCYSLNPSHAGMRVGVACRCLTESSHPQQHSAGPLFLLPPFRSIFASLLSPLITLAWIHHSIVLSVVCSLWSSEACPAWTTLPLGLFHITLVILPRLDYFPSRSVFSLFTLTRLDYSPHRLL